MLPSPRMQGFGRGVPGLHLENRHKWFGLFFEKAESRVLGPVGQIADDKSGGLLGRATDRAESAVRFVACVRTRPLTPALSPREREPVPSRAPQAVACSPKTGPAN